MEWHMGSPVKQIPYRQHVYSSEITRRRKALFQTGDKCDNDNGLGPINLLCEFDACNNDDNDFTHFPKSSFSFFQKVLKDIASRRNETNPVCDITDTDSCDLSATGTPPHLISLNQSQSSSPKNITINETPVKDSPSKNFKTPDDTSSANTVVPKLSRKLDTSINMTHSHDEHTPDSSLSKDSSGKSSKVRTTLFPDIVLPTKSFYPKTDHNRDDIAKTHIQPIQKASKQKLPTVYLCRRGKKWNRVGKINGGVHHGIKKPKMKKAKDMVLKIVDNFDNSMQNEFLENLNRVKEPPQINRDNLKIVEVVHKQTDVHTPDNEKENNRGLVSKKKFFKSARSCNVTTAVNGNKNVAKKDKINSETKHLDHFDLNVAEVDGSLNNVVTKIIVGLNNDIKKEQATTEVQLQSVPLSDIKNNLEALNDRKRKVTEENVTGNVEDVLLSPTSQMCNMASCLAIRSPKRAKLNLNTLLVDGFNDSNDNVFNKISSSPDMDKKLFPIFYPASREDKIKVTTKKAVEYVDKSPVKKWKALPKDQMILDAGQKRFGVTQCIECETIYHMGDPNEEIMHLNNHNAVNVLRFNGWKNERVVTICGSDQRVIKIIPGDSKAWWKRVIDLLGVIGRELGSYVSEINQKDFIIFLCIKNKIIVGCLVATGKSQAYKMLTTNSNVDLCSQESYPVKCGVSMIWVSQRHRQQGVATVLMNSLKKNFVYGCILRNEDLALSSPTDMGKAFAAKYFNTPNFFIYMN